MSDKSFFHGVKLAKVSSDSMFPVLQKGDLVLFKTASNPNKGDLIGFYSARKIPMVHRLIDQDKKFLYTIADGNDKFDEAIKRNLYLGKVAKIKINQQWIGIHHKLISAYFFIIQYLSRKIANKNQPRLFLMLRWLIAWELRFILQMISWKKYFSGCLLKDEN